MDYFFQNYGIEKQCTKKYIKSYKQFYMNVKSSFVGIPFEIIINTISYLYIFSPAK
tara:strand:- start:1983 stop:2150 length:168 start_codon:yes stop_codon:yes gene_type:complete